MKAFLPLVTSLISGEIGVAVGNIKRDGIFLAIIAVFGVIAVVFALVALESTLAYRYGSVEACLFIAGGALVIALILYIAMRIADARAKRKARLRREANNAAAYTTAAVTFLPFLLRSKATLAVGVPLAALAGFMLAPSRSRRRRGGD